MRFTLAALTTLSVTSTTALAFTSTTLSSTTSSRSTFASRSIFASSSSALNICWDPFCNCLDNTDADADADTDTDALLLRYGPPTRRRMLQQSTKASAASVSVAVLNTFGITNAEPAFAASALAAVDVAQKKCFPTALRNADFESKLFTALSTNASSKFDARNTLLATSFCPDEINGAFSDSLVKRYGESFPLGGLAGVPFVGASGMDAFLHHVPDGGVDGKVLMVFAPHVGIDDEGKIGKIQRVGQKGETGACGAAVGAYKYLMNKKEEERAKTAEKSGEEGKPIDITADATAKQLMADRAVVDMMDGQEEYIINQLETRLQGIDQALDPIAFITYQMYDIVKELLMAELDYLGDGLWEHTKDLAIVGGITINRSKQSGGDCFQPLMFELRKPKGEVIDLFEPTFGKRPNLVPIMGTNIALSENSALDTFFPGALPIKVWDDKLYALISSSKYAFNNRNTLLASSICPDEINGPFVKMITNRYGENFPLGGLAGLPFVGKSGVDAFLHHVPDAVSGKVLIVFAPHVAISSEDVVGKILRLDQNNLSSACGAAVGALKVLQAQKAVSASDNKKSKISILDNQEEYILSMLESRIKNINNAPDPIAYLTYQVYEIIQEYMFAIFDRLGSGVWAETSNIIFAGGILINRPKENGDYFMPLLLESHTAEGKSDIYEEAFGLKPNLKTIRDV